jgi:hypothetical protein
MKKYILCLTISLFAIGLSFAQRPGERYDPEKLQAARIAFITSRLDLKPEQAEKFWPLFNRFNDNRETYLKEISKMSDLRSGEISESEAKKRLEQRFDIQRKILAEEEKYVNDLSKVITYNQILKLNGLARDFTRAVYQRQKREKEKKKKAALKPLLF